jgi:hypothetical protein
MSETEMVNIKLSIQEFDITITTTPKLIRTGNLLQVVIRYVK